MNSRPLIKTVMTPFPHSIDVNAPIAEVFEMMGEHEIRHLPVTYEGKLYGMISERDARTASSLAERFQKQIAVRDVCSTDPYKVDLNTSLKIVVGEMAKTRIGSVVVLKKNKVVGIFTTTDACAYLSELLSGPDEDPTHTEYRKAHR